MARAKRKPTNSNAQAESVPEPDAEPITEIDEQLSSDHSAAIEPLETSAGQDVATLVPGGDLDEASAEVVDTELAQLMKTPLGLRGAVEALLFSSPDPLTIRRMCNALAVPDSKSVAAAVQQLRDEYDEQRRGLQIIDTAQGYQMATRELFGDFILRLRGRKRRPPLSAATLETLAIIAYRQPVIRSEIEAIRGVESSGTLRNLIDMGVVEISGRREVLGRPAEYGTTETFLQSFGLRSLKDLPPVAELKKQLAERESAAAQAANVQHITTEEQTMPTATLEKEELTATPALLAGALGSVALALLENEDRIHAASPDDDEDDLDDDGDYEDDEDEDFDDDDDDPGDDDEDDLDDDDDLGDDEDDLDDDDDLGDDEDDDEDTDEDDEDEDEDDEE